MKEIKEAINQINETKPLILNLTNFVTMDFVANCLLAVGASPIVCVCEDELEELVSIASVVYINIGTLNDDFNRLIRRAVCLALQYHKPIVLDPVGCGASRLRTSVASELVARCQLVRGNASEIMALGNTAFSTKGVDSVHRVEDAIEAAAHITEQGVTVFVSGAVDHITDGLHAKEIRFGSPMMTNITGMGCALTAVIAAVLAIKPDAFAAAVIGGQYFSLCGELVADKYQHPGSFKSAFFDMLYAPDFEVMRKLYDQ